MTDCQSTLAALLPSAEYPTTTASETALDHLSSFTTTSSDGSPPYSHSASEQHESPEGTDMYNRTESPSSAQLNVDFVSANGGYSPDNVATSSERDESPDTISTSSVGATDTTLSTAERIDPKANLSTSQIELQKQLMRLQSFKPDFAAMFSSLASATTPGAMDGSASAPTTPATSMPPTPQAMASLGVSPFNAASFMAAFNNSLMASKLASAFSAPGAKFPSTPTMPASLPSTPAADMTNIVMQPQSNPPQTKRKRQRRNPVWPYFDVVDGTARCKQCMYSTKSVFSTNLKVHLRSHHRADYEKVIQAEDALNLNALLLSGNGSKIFNTDITRKRIPPMTSSILMTINKLANQASQQAANGDENPLNSVLRQTLAAGGLTQQLQQTQSQLQPPVQQQQQQFQQPKTESESASESPAPNALSSPATPTPQTPQFTLNAANLAALNQLQNQLKNNSQIQAGNTATNLPAFSPEQFLSQFGSGFPANPVKMEHINAPHGTDPNGVPQPKRRRLRRHPVWMFFRDLEDRMVGCINCEFRTGSAFSTNLKMHLKAHHKEDYERVLQLEEEMRIEEGIFGPPNKIKTELIDFIRGGGNASTPPASGNTSQPKPSPLVQQIISQTLANRPASNSDAQTPSNGNTAVKRESGAEDESHFNSLSMADKLAALVGLTPQAGAVEGEIPQQPTVVADLADIKSPALGQDINSNLSAFEELRKVAQRLMATNMGLAPPPQETTLIDLNGSVLSHETKSTSSASTDGGSCEESKKLERDKALAKFWAQQGGADNFLQCQYFKSFLRTLAPEYEIPEVAQLVELLEDDI